MSPRHPNTLRTRNLTNSKHKGKQNPDKHAAATRTNRSKLARLPVQQAERTLALADFLPTPEALAVREVLARGRSISQLAKLLNEPRHRTRTRIARLLARTTDPAFGFVIARMLIEADDRPRHNAAASPAALARWPDDWPTSMRTAAQLCIIEGCTSREAARRSGFSAHTLRRHLTTLREIGSLWRSNTLPRDAA